MVLLPNLIQALDQLSIARYAKLLPFGQKKLLVDQVTKKIFLMAVVLLERPIILVGVLVQLCLRACDVGVGDDPIIHASDNLHHGRAVDAGQIVTGVRVQARAKDRSGFCWGRPFGLRSVWGLSRAVDAQGDGQDQR